MRPPGNLAADDELPMDLVVFGLERVHRAGRDAGGEAGGERLPPGVELLAAEDRLLEHAMALVARVGAVAVGRLLVAGQHDLQRAKPQPPALPKQQFARPAGMPGWSEISKSVGPTAVASTNWRTNTTTSPIPTARNGTKKLTSTQSGSRSQRPWTATTANPDTIPFHSRHAVSHSPSVHAGEPPRGSR